MLSLVVERDAEGQRDEVIGGEPRIGGLEQAEAVELGERAAMASSGALDIQWSESKAGRCPASAATSRVSVA